VINESQIEARCIEWFQDIGWVFAHGPEIAPESAAAERTDYRSVILRERLVQALARLNPSFPREALEEAAHVATTAAHPNVVHSNRAFHRLLLDGVLVEFSRGDRKVSDHVRLIDFSPLAKNKNDFLVVNQFTVAGTKQPRRPDLVVFINGLPLSIIELKNPGDADTGVWEAFDQLQTYKDEIGDLFVFNQALIASDGLTARVGSLTASREWFMPWRTIRNEDDRPVLEFELEKIVRGFFDRELFLDYLRYFVLFEQSGDRLIKKIAGYHQFHGVREAVRVTLIAAQSVGGKGVVEEPRAPYGREVVAGSRKAGVFWHTQGSGKSISMCCYAGKLIQQPEMNNPTIVVVTDRNDLDGQLYEQFDNAKDLLKQAPEQANDREELREKLAARQSGGIIFTTIQKFSLLDGEKAHPPLCRRENVVVISDEAHRSQYGLKARLVDEKDKVTKKVIGKKYVYGFAKHMRDALPTASFIGFTGTPIAKDDRDTRAVFGDYVSIYDIQDAVDDKATVPIYYESRLAKLVINRAKIDKLNKDVEDIVEDEEDAATREKTKSRWAKLEELVRAKPRIEEVAADLVRHFETRTATLEGKAMVVCMSRLVCVALFDAIIALRPQWAGTKRKKDGKEIGYDPEDGAIRIVMTGTATDKARLQEHVFTNQQKKRLEKRFKDPADSLKLVIVRDMWLTGFDAPPCHTMYVDKPMHGHSLMQAIARVNRVFRGKEGGLVVDSIGIAAELQRALKVYIDAKGKGDPTRGAEQALAVLLEKVDVVRGMFHGFDYSEFETEALELLVPSANHILGLKTRNARDGKKRFLDVMAAITTAYSLCSTLDEAAALRHELAFFTAIKNAIVKHTTVERKRTEDEKNSALKQILDNAVVSEGVQDVFALAGLEKPNIGLLSDEFLEDLRSMPERNLAVELLERLLRDEIKAHTRTNVVLEKKYGDRLIETLRKYNNRGIETKQVIQEMIAMAKDFQGALERNEALGLTKEEIAFYDALAEKPEVLEKMGDESLKQLAVELTEKLRQNTSVDWQVRDSVRATMRLLIKRLLRKHRYPPEGQEAAVDLVLRQAEELADVWSSRETFHDCASAWLRSQLPVGTWETVAAEVSTRVERGQQRITLEEVDRIAESAQAEPDRVHAVLTSLTGGPSPLLEQFFYDLERGERFAIRAEEVGKRLSGRNGAEKEWERWAKTVGVGWRKT
jgi:type I restriction enzyme, R subunit